MGLELPKIIRKHGHNVLYGLVAMIRITHRLDTSQAIYVCQEPYAGVFGRLLEAVAPLRFRLRVAG